MATLIGSSYLEDMWRYAVQMKSLDPAFQSVINDHFWELTDAEKQGADPLRNVIEKEVVRLGGV